MENKIIRILAKSVVLFVKGMIIYLSISFGLKFFNKSEVIMRQYVIFWILIVIPAAIGYEWLIKVAVIKLVELVKKNPH